MSRILKNGYVPLGSAEPGSDPGRRAWIKIIFTKTTWQAPLSRALDGLAPALSLIGIVLAWLPPNQQFAHEVKAGRRG